jgi:WD40 repeat protein
MQIIQNGSKRLVLKPKIARGKRIGFALTRVVLLASLLSLLYFVSVIGQHYSLSCARAEGADLSCTYQRSLLGFSLETREIVPQEARLRNNTQVELLTAAGDTVLLATGFTGQVNQERIEQVNGFLADSEQTSLELAGFDLGGPFRGITGLALYVGLAGLVVGLVLWYVQGSVISQIVMNRKRERLTITHQRAVGTWREKHPLADLLAARIKHARHTLREQISGGEDVALIMEHTVISLHCPTRKVAEDLVSRVQALCELRTEPDPGIVQTLHVESLPPASWRLPHQSLVVSPDSHLLALAIETRMIWLWNLEDGTLLHMLNSEHGRVHDLSFAPDGQIIAAGCGDSYEDKRGEGGVEIWHVRDGQLMRTLSEKRPQAITGVAYAPSGQTIAAGRESGALLLWQAKGGKAPQNILKLRQGEVRSVAFLPDSQTLVAGYQRGMVGVWRARDRLLLHRLNGHTKAVTSVAVHPNGQIAASAGVDCTVQIWRLSDGKLLHTLEGHREQVNAVAFAPDGLMLASAADDGLVRLWELEEGRLLHTFDARGQAALSVAFVPNGSALAAGYADNRVHIWRLRDDDRSQFYEDDEPAYESAEEPAYAQDDEPAYAQEEEAVADEPDELHEREPEEDEREREEVERANGRT